MSYYAVTYSNSLSHHGIKGQKWGRRRFQNQDGSLTPEGHKRYGIGERIHNLNSKRLMSAARTADADAADLRKHGYKKEAAAVQKVADRNREKANRPYKPMTDEQKAKLKKGLMIAAGVAAVGAAAYAGHKYMQNNKALEKLMSEANTKIDIGKARVKLLEQDSLSVFDAAKSADISERRIGRNVTDSVKYLGNDLREHTARYDVSNGRFGPTRYFDNYGADTQKTFKTLREYKKARKNAGLTNYVTSKKYKKEAQEKLRNEMLDRLKKVEEAENNRALYKAILNRETPKGEIRNEIDKRLEQWAKMENSKATLSREIPNDQIKDEITKRLEEWAKKQMK